MKILAARIRRAIAVSIPGTAINIAEQKRAYERECRAAGHSRAEAKRMVWERYRSA